MLLTHTFAEWVDFQCKSTKGKIIMAGMLVQHTVKDFENWKKVYDSQAALRISNGFLSDQIYHDANDRNKLVILFKWNSLENARKFSRSPELKASMEKAGVDGMPTITFLNDTQM
jgi:heme-degrading monooxygenase HmoA